MLLAPKRESEAATRALDELEELLKRPEPQTTLVLVAGTLDKRSRMYKLLGEAGDAGRVRRDRESGRRRALDSQPRGGRRDAQIDPAGARLHRGARGTDVKRPAQRRRSAAALRAGPEDDHGRRCDGRSSGRRRCRTTGR